MLVASPAEAQSDSTRIDAMLASIDTIELRAHTRFLADELLAGRRLGTPGAAVAARYVASQFETAGLDPSGHGGSFLTTRTLSAVEADAHLIFGAGRRTLTVSPSSEFVAWPLWGDSVRAVDGDVVFVAHGVQAPAPAWDDFKDTPLAGKILLMLGGDPGDADSTVFGGRATSASASLDAKLAAANRAGAAGVIVVHPTDGEPWAQAREPWVGQIIRNPQPAVGPVRFAALATEEAARRVAEFASLDYDALVRRAGRREFVPVRVPLRAAVDMASREGPVRAENVIGRCTGTDPDAEPVLVLSGYDHVGTVDDGNGPATHVGAARPATAAAALVALAGALCQPTGRPTRSVYFATIAGGPWSGSVDMGLAREGGWHATVVLDEIDLWGDTVATAVDGAGLTGVAPLVSRAARAEGLMAQDAGLPGRPDFFRSLAYAAARVGMPVLRVRGADGDDLQEGVRQRRASIRATYGDATDTMRSDWSYAGAMRQMRTAARLVWALANSEGRMVWDLSSPFRRAAPPTER